MTKNEFDKMLRVAILEDRIKYGSDLICELKKLIPPFSDALHAFNKRRCEALNKIKIEELNYPPLTYEAISCLEKPNVQKSLNDEIWDQRRYDLSKNILSSIWNNYDYCQYSNEYKITAAIRIADKFIEYFKKKEI